MQGPELSSHESNTGPDGTAFPTRPLVSFAVLKYAHAVPVCFCCSQCDELVKEGATLGETPAKVVQSCDITFAMLSDPDAALAVSATPSPASSQRSWAALVSQSPVLLFVTIRRPCLVRTVSCKASRQVSHEPQGLAASVSTADAPCTQFIAPCSTP